MNNNYESLLFTLGFINLHYKVMSQVNLTTSKFLHDTSVKKQDGV